MELNHILHPFQTVTQLNARMMGGSACSSPRSSISPPAHFALSFSILSSDKIEKIGQDVDELALGSAPVKTVGRFVGTPLHSFKHVSVEYTRSTVM